VKYPEYTEISTAGIDRIVWTDSTRLLEKRGSKPPHDLGINRCRCAPAIVGDEIFWLGENGIRSSRRDIIPNDPKAFQTGVRVGSRRLYWIEIPKEEHQMSDTAPPLERIKSSTLSGEDIRTVAEQVRYSPHVVSGGDTIYWPEYDFWFGGFGPIPRDPRDTPPSHLIIRTPDHIVLDEERPPWKEMDPAADLAVAAKTLLWSDDGRIRAMPVSGGLPETIGEATTGSLPRGEDSSRLRPHLRAQRWNLLSFSESMIEELRRSSPARRTNHQCSDFSFFSLLSA
jgi:hypothetical protein